MLICLREVRVYEFFSKRRPTTNNIVFLHDNTQTRRSESVEEVRAVDFFSHGQAFRSCFTEEISAHVGPSLSSGGTTNERTNE